MATMPGVELRLLPPGCNHTSGGMGPIHGCVEHVIVGSLVAADSAFRNPAWRASAHFGVAKTGHTVQWVDTADKAWAEAAGNPNWISIEFEGYPSEPLTPEQIDAGGRILRWAHDTHGGFALQVTDDVNGYGLGVHYMGGAAWGGHSCPGPIRAGQRAEIVRRASGAPTPQPPPIPTPPPAAQEDDDMSIFVGAVDPATGALTGPVYERSAAQPLYHVPTPAALADLWYQGFGHSSVPADANVKTFPNGVRVIGVAQRYIDELK